MFVGIRRSRDAAIAIILRKDEHQLNVNTKGMRIKSAAISKAAAPACRAATLLRVNRMRQVRHSGSAMKARTNSIASTGDSLAKALRDGNVVADHYAAR